MRRTPVTRAVTRMAANDEARHVAFGVAHLRESARHEPSLLDRLAQSVHRRHEALRHTAGLNQEVHDSLVLVAAGSWDHNDLREGSRKVSQLLVDMDMARKRTWQGWASAISRPLHSPCCTPETSCDTPAGCFKRSPGTVCVAGYGTLGSQLACELSRKLNSHAITATITIGVNVPQLLEA